MSTKRRALKPCPDGPCPADRHDCKGGGFGCYKRAFERNTTRTAKKEHRCKYGLTIQAGEEYKHERLFIVPWADAGPELVVVDYGKKCTGRKCFEACFAEAQKWPEPSAKAIAPRCKAYSHECEKKPCKAGRQGAEKCKRKKPPVK